MSFWSWIEGLFNGLKDWVHNILSGYYILFHDYIFKMFADFTRSLLNSLFENIAKIIKQIHVAELEAKFHFSKWLTKFYNTTAGFFVIIIASAAAIMIVPAVISWASKVLAKIGFWTWLKAAESTVASWKGWVTVNLLVEANRAAQVLFKNWGDLWAGIYQDLGSLGENLGLGIGALAAATTAVRALLVSFNTTLGMDSITAEISSLGDMTGWIQGLSNNFDRYAENPQDIWNDLWTKVIVPKQGEIKQYFEKIGAAIAIINNKIELLEKVPGEFVAYQKTLTKLLGVTLTKENAAREKWTLDKINGAIDAYNKQIGVKIDKIESLITPLNDAIINHDDALKREAARIKALQNPDYSLPVNMTPIDWTELLGPKIAIGISYWGSDQATKDVNDFTEILGNAFSYSVGTLSKEEFTSYMNKTGTFETEIVNPFEV